MTTDMSDEEVMAHVIDKLSDEHSAVPLPLIEDVVRTEFKALTGGPVRDYLSVLTERAARQRLQELSQTNA